MGQPRTITADEANSMYVVYPCTALATSTAEADMYELWPRAKVEDNFTLSPCLPKEISMRVKDSSGGAPKSVNATRWGDLSCATRPEAYLTKEMLEAKTKDGFQHPLTHT